MPQTVMLNRYRAVDHIDLVGRVEQFQHGMKYVLDMAGYRGDADLSGRFNEGPEPPFKFAQVMTDQIDSMLHEIYRQDLNEFGYR